MYNEILAKKVIVFIIPSITIGKSLQINIHDYQKRRTLWQLLKSTMENIDFPLIRQFEKNPTGHHLSEATVCLLSLKFQEDKNLVTQVELFLDTQQDIALAEKAHLKRDRKRPKQSSHRRTLSFRSKWQQRRLLY